MVSQSLSSAVVNVSNNNKDEANNNNDDEDDGTNKKMLSPATSKVTVATQTGQDDLSFCSEKMTLDENCYECKVKYRDPKPKDLIMYLHAWKYKVSIRNDFHSYYYYYLIDV